MSKETYIVYRIGSLLAITNDEDTVTKALQMSNPGAQYQVAIVCGDDTLHVQHLGLGGWKQRQRLCVMNQRREQLAEELAILDKQIAELQ